MALITASWTDEGLTKAQHAAATPAWYIKPSYFGVSATYVDTATTALNLRTIDNLEVMFTKQIVSAKQDTNVNTIKAICTVPTGSSSATTVIQEIYLFAEDTDAVELVSSGDFLTETVLATVQSAWTGAGAVTFSTKADSNGFLQIPVGTTLSQDIVVNIDDSYAIDILEIISSGVGLGSATELTVSVYDGASTSTLITSVTAPSGST